MSRDTALVFIAATLIWIAQMISDLKPHIREAIRIYAQTYNNGCLTK